MVKWDYLLCGLLGLLIGLRFSSMSFIQQQRKSSEGDNNVNIVLSFGVITVTPVNINANKPPKTSKDKA